MQFFPAALVFILRIANHTLLIVPATLTTAASTGTVVSPGGTLNGTVHVCLEQEGIGEVLRNPLYVFLQG